MFLEDRRKTPAFQLPRPTASRLVHVSLKTLASCCRFKSVLSNAQVIESILTQAAAQPMSAEVQQPTPHGRGARVASTFGKSQVRIPLFSRLCDGVRDLFDDFE